MINVTDIKSLPHHSICVMHFKLVELTSTDRYFLRKKDIERSETDAKPLDERWEKGDYRGDTRWRPSTKMWREWKKRAEVRRLTGFERLSQCSSTVHLFLRRGAKLYSQIGWGPWPDCPPLDPSLEYIQGSPHCHVLISSSFLKTWINSRYLLKINDP